MKKLNIDELKIIESSLETELVFYDDCIIIHENDKKYITYLRKESKKVQKLLNKIKKEVMKYEI